MRSRLIIAAVAIALPVFALAQSMQHQGMAQGDQSASSKAFEAANQATMKNMMMPMTGNADRDFATMMIAHHQGAIEMARIELQYGKDPELRSMAENVIQAQGKEIEQLKRWQQKNRN